jgi:hypothetical protein
MDKDTGTEDKQADNNDADAIHQFQIPVDCFV